MAQSQRGRVSFFLSHHCMGCVCVIVSLSLERKRGNSCTLLLPSKHWPKRESFHEFRSLWFSQVYWLRALIKKSTGRSRGQTAIPHLLGTRIFGRLPTIFLSWVVCICSRRQRSIASLSLANLKTRPIFYLVLLSFWSFCFSNTLLALTFK